ncbi:hypothetical protein D3Y57_10435 [Sphingomonas paeninsulae]|uniref:Uncharacterized protein n=1 Tax=Sphingomonas paeninsulae TaxID=2319844 RepID=A0A494TH72_SPHPE|nr:hypothetical protein [Sphingomonas paeninsulae]AYJ86303.1 hypothetical protein D3Y57_10435 [Sphingomonas paeninsulae]
MMMRIFSTAILLAASACATTVAARDEGPDTAFAKAIAGKIAGKPRSCISVTDTRDSTTFRNAIVYRVNSKLSYVNDLGKCPFLRSDYILVTNVRGSQICRGEIVNMVDRGSGFPSGSCSYGDFIPYQTLAK